MRRPWARAIGAAVLACMLAAAPGAPPAALEPSRLAAAMDAVRVRDWPRAAAEAGRAGDPVAIDIVAWHRLRAGAGSWPDYTQFLSRNPDWPGLPLMRKAAEAEIPEALPAAELRAFFTGRPPQTGRGARLLAGALDGDAARDVIARAWVDLDLGEAEEARFLSLHNDIVTPLHEARLARLLRAGRTDAAERLLPLLAPGAAALARARIRLQTDTPGVDAAIEAVPDALADDPGLALDRFEWRLRRARWDDAEALLLARSTSAAALGAPEAWASRRRALARMAMRQGRSQTAYRLASRHFLEGGANYADLEWLSGYLALTRLGDPGQAAAHFRRFDAAVETPISKGRAGYWLGRALEAAGDPQGARAAWAAGAEHQTSFYGQLAAERGGIAPDARLAGIGPDARLAGAGALPGWRGRPFADTGPLRAALLLQAAGESVIATRFFLHVEESLAPQDAAALAGLAREAGLDVAAVRIGKRLAEDHGQIWPGAYYPLTSAAAQAVSVPPELALAVARQESELNPVAISPAGARGLMQLMPATAQKMAGDLGLPYDAGRLTADPAYNVRLGSGYLAEMLGRYGGSVLLAAAAYNAGPGRVDQWLREYGDPRRPGVDPIDWIEGIPFRETRNYVMRVTEGIFVYRTRLTGNAGEIGLARTLGMDR